MTLSSTLIGGDGGASSVGGTGGVGGTAYDEITFDPASAPTLNGNSVVYGGNGGSNQEEGTAGNGGQAVSVLNCAGTGNITLTATANTNISSLPSGYTDQLGTGGAVTTNSGTAGRRVSDAFTNATNQGRLLDGTAVSNAYSTGGAGGSISSSAIGNGGAGGTSVASAYAASSSSGSMTAVAVSVGGKGGQGVFTGFTGGAGAR